MNGRQVGSKIGPGEETWFPSFLQDQEQARRRIVTLVEQARRRILTLVEQARTFMEEGKVVPAAATMKTARLLRACGTLKRADSSGRVYEA